MQYNNKSRKMYRTISKQKILIVLCLSVAIATSLASSTYVVSAASENKTLSQTQSTQSMATNNTNMNIVLVHGAWADGSGWNKVIPILTAAGHKVIAVQLPLHSLSDDVATVKRAIEHIGGQFFL